MEFFGVVVVTIIIIIIIVVAVTPPFLNQCLSQSPVISPLTVFVQLIYKVSLYLAFANV